MIADRKSRNTNNFHIPSLTVCRRQQHEVSFVISVCIWKSTFISLASVWTFLSVCLSRLAYTETNSPDSSADADSVRCCSSVRRPNALLRTSFKQAYFSADATPRV